MQDQSQPLAPIMAGERMEVVDVLRGVALLGILLWRWLTYARRLGMHLGPARA